MQYPELHFQTSLFKELSEAFPGEMQLGPLVTPGALLVTLPELAAVPTSGKTKNDCPLDIEPGLNTLVTEEDTIIAACYGYPQSEVVTESNEQTIIRVSILPLISKNDTKMEALLWLLPFPGEYDQVDQNAIEAALIHQKIHFGVDRKAIESSLVLLKETGEPVIDALIARGKPPRHGVNAYLRFHLEIGPIAGRELADGSIDFRERRMFVEVEKGQEIATKIPLTPGSSGKDIEGNELPARPGHDLTIKVSDDASYDEEDKTVRATASGILTVVNDDSIRVLSKHQIQGDIDYSTGHIRSRNAVEISGAVLPKFVVSVGGDLLVGGNVQSAAINTRGNVVVKGGVVGPHSTVVSSGDGDFNYIERGYVSVGGNAVVRSAVYYTTLRAGGNVLGTEKTRLVGGSIIAAGSIKVGQIGAGSAKPMLVGAGIIPRRYKRHKGLQLRHDKVVNSIQKLANLHGQVDRNSKKFKFLVEELEELEKELYDLNLMGHDAENMNKGNGSYHCEATIEVSGVLTAGTTVRICNSIRIVEYDMVNVQARVNPANGEIDLITIL